MLCQYCEKPLGDLTSVMDKLSQNKMNGELDFQSECCGGAFKAYSKVMAYYLVPVDPVPEGRVSEPVLINHA
ncbi:hypothetical protein [Halomonas sp. BC04]|uniref:hypothetical protein n=1 Tax=Halomonas sp. BC04 TaxID=1403540 RepID=UPI0003ED6661|nr:hypothetical protein [Halomonas sp. BC04]EWH02092.1 hypothetical protein Q427_10590 [Halomonas sp. BC04]